jgi:hypothetical protein
VLDGDTPEILQKRVMEQAEWIILPKAAEIVAKRISDDKLPKQDDADYYGYDSADKISLKTIFEKK